MPPLFLNPHLLPQHFETISRKDLLYQDEKRVYVETASVTEALDRMIEDTLPSLKHYRSGDFLKSSSKKRRKIEVDEPVLDEPVLFRLVSSARPPLPVSLLSPPPPPPVTREPDIEDDDQQAQCRCQRAEAVAVDGITILRDAASSETLRHSGKVLVAKTEATFTDPPFLVMQALQQPRKDRPPVAAADLRYFPYVGKTCALHPHSESKAKSCAVVDIQLLQAKSRKSSRRHRRKKLTEASRAPPVAQFWRAESLMTCRGYGFGY